MKCFSAYQQTKLCFCSLTGPQVAHDFQIVSAAVIHIIPRGATVKVWMPGTSDAKPELAPEHSFPHCLP